VTENVSEMAAGLAEGTLIAGYRIERQIGAGGMAVVFRAYDERLCRPGPARSSPRSSPTP
jgi:hypothetical protein